MARTSTAHICHLSGLRSPAQTQGSQSAGFAKLPVLICCVATGGVLLA